MADFLKGIGIVSWLIGAWLIYSGFAMDVTVNPDGSGEVANFQLMHNQQIGILLGALAVLEGTVALVGGCIIDAITDQAKRLTPPSD